MIAYYVHWCYPARADNVNFYSGQDDDKLFRHKENAEKYAEQQLKQWQKDENRFYELDIKDNEEGLTLEEQDEWNKLAYIHGDLPCDYNIKERDIEFEDEL